LAHASVTGSGVSTLLAGRAVGVTFSYRFRRRPQSDFTPPVRGSKCSIVRFHRFTLALSLLTTLTVARGTAARPFRVGEIPNGSVASCLTCHVYPGGPRNAFGVTVESYGGVGFLVDGHVQWGNLALLDPSHPGDPPKTLGEIDSDGDGRNNAAELLDPTGSFRIGYGHPGNSELVRLPGLNDAPVIIRQIYAGGGASGATFRHDFVELFNRSSAPVSLSGWSVQFAPATGPVTFGSSATAITELPSVVMNPGQSLLVQGATGGAVGALLSSADVIDSTPLALADGAGKLALVASTTPLACNGFPTVCPAAASSLIVDLVGYGNAMYYEGLSGAPAPSSESALVRARGGCTDINSNGSDNPLLSADFSLAPPTPRTSASPATPCGGAVPGPIAAPALPPALPRVLALLLAGLGVLTVARRPGSRA
jgi:hypothetical protein